jgi:hypothetical protein
MKGGWLLLIAPLMIGACSSDEGEYAPVSGEARPARDGPTRPPQAHIEGNYSLVYADGDGLPAILEQTATCHTEVVDATLRIEAGRFAFQNRVREVCSGIAREPVMHAAGGTIVIAGNEVVLHADVGDAFTEARGVADEESIMIQQLASDGGVVSLAWRFDRLGPELVPLEGTGGT